MTGRWFKVATVISAILLSLTITAMIASSWLRPPFVGDPGYKISIGPHFHICLFAFGDGLDVRLAFFNDADYGPYRGSIIGISDGQGHIYPPVLSRHGFGDTFGLYFRYFHWQSGDKLWTLMISLWYFVLAFAVPPGVWLIRNFRWRSSGRRSERFCARCGYDLRGAPTGECPECGQRNAPASR